MVQIDTILTFLEETFQSAKYPDVSYNGLQFEGRQKIKHVVTGVDAVTPFFKRAVAVKADLAIVHHGLFWKGREWRRIDRLACEKVKVLAEGNFNLYALHLPLDSHSEFGNNIRIAMALGAQPTGGFGEFMGQKIGIAATFETAITTSAFKKTIEKAIGPVLCHLNFGPDKIRHVGIVSGGGWESITDPLVAAGKIDVILTGEIIHQAVAPCRDLGVHMISAGHYATETFGVKALGELLSRKFGVKHTFLDFPSGL